MEVLKTGQLRDAVERDLVNPVLTDPEWVAGTPSAEQVVRVFNFLKVYNLLLLSRLESDPATPWVETHGEAGHKYEHSSVTWALRIAEKLTSGPCIKCANAWLTSGFDPQQMKELKEKLRTGMRYDFEERRACQYDLYHEYSDDAHKALHDRMMKIREALDEFVNPVWQWITVPPMKEDFNTVQHYLEQEYLAMHSFGVGSKEEADNAANHLVDLIVAEGADRHTMGQVLNALHKYRESYNELESYGCRRKGTWPEKMKRIVSDWKRLHFAFWR